MRELETLIKMHKLQVDQQRRVLAERQKEADTLTAMLAELHAALEAEKEKAKDDPESYFQIGPYIKKELDRQAKLKRNLLLKEKEVDAERDKLAVMFEELKRYEIAETNWQEQRKAELQKRETQSYDELAGVRFQRDKE
jgi:flagellar FliJ protein